MTIYHKIYKEHFGSIPKDDDGRSYEIHHIDGDRTNNDPSNLKAVTIHEHYDIHYAQGDYGACYKIAKRMKILPEEISALGRNIANARVCNGTHPWLDRQKQSARAKQRIFNGTHHFLNSEFQREMSRRAFVDKKHPWYDREKQKQKAIKRTEEGNNPFSGAKINRMMLENGRHPSQNRVECERCGKEMSYAKVS